MEELNKINEISEEDEESDESIQFTVKKEGQDIVNDLEFQID
jgi:hypothetical protein